MLSLLKYSQLPPDRCREAATLLFAHLPSAERSERIDQWLAAVERGELNAETILTAWWADCIVGVQVVELLVGKSAALWAVRARSGDERRAIEDALLQAALDLLRGNQVKVAQCLLTIDEFAAIDALRRNEFRRLTSVRHLRAANPSIELQKHAYILFQPYAECDTGTFKSIFAESFEGTLDCPELNDLRTPDEILAGHIASASDLSRWWLIQYGGEPAGVLILADAALPELWDLAYVGVLPPFRRRGIGRMALGFAFKQAALAHKDGISLMVDERNRPALQLYESAGFQVMGTREVYLWVSGRQAV